MVRVVSLQHDPPRSVLAPRPSGNLMQDLEGPLRRSEVSTHEAEVGIDYTDQRQHREMMALGDDLGAQDDVDLMIRDRLDEGSGGAGPAYRVAGHQG